MLVPDPFALTKDQIRDYLGGVALLRPPARTRTEAEALGIIAPGGVGTDHPEYNWTPRWLARHTLAYFDALPASRDWPALVEGQWWWRTDITPPDTMVGIEPGRVVNRAAWQILNPTVDIELIQAELMVFQPTSPDLLAAVTATTPAILEVPHTEAQWVEAVAMAKWTDPILVDVDLGGLLP